MKARSLCLKVLLLVLLTGCVRVVRAQAPADSPLAGTSEADQITGSERQLIRDVRAQLIAGKYDEIDRTADAFRRDKSRWNGGKWKLKTLYEALDAPHETDKDTVDHLNHLRDWTQQRPESITARVALATSLKRWAWVARGSGTADKVTTEGWRLFNQRIGEAQAVLQGSEDMRTMCPQWYIEEMIVGLAQGWDAHQMEDLFERAVQFEPDYPYFYKERANYLLPKWYGSGQQATSFARDAADREGGDLGDYLYFEMAMVIIKRGNGNITPMVQAMDWQRIQRGYQALQTMYGTSRDQKNAFAYMAYKFQDKAMARQQFVVIGDRWSAGVWRDRKYFDRVRDWSNGHTEWPTTSAAESD